MLPFYSTQILYPNNNYPQQYFDLHSTDKNSIGCRLCYDTDCYNGGHCSEPTTTYKCQCPEGFAADDCSVDINECEDNKCQNNATCIDKIAKYECNCIPGFDGI